MSGKSVTSGDIKIMKRVDFLMMTTVLSLGALSFSATLAQAGFQWHPPAPPAVVAPLPAQPVAAAPAPVAKPVEAAPVAAPAAAHSSHKHPAH